MNKMYFEDCTVAVNLFPNQGKRWELGERTLSITPQLGGAFIFLSE